MSESNESNHMKSMPLNKRGLHASRISLGCMGFGGEWAPGPIYPEHIKQAEAAVEAALEVGINFFDHADIYRSGKAEKVFGELLKTRPGLRESIYIQSKCGIRFAESDSVPGRYDFSKSHIVQSVDGSLQRLGIEYLDVLLLHRPDPLMDPDEVGHALDTLHRSGKVRYFGVSNMNAGQIALLASGSTHPFIVNQLELSLLHTGFVDTGVHVNQVAAQANYFPDGTMEYMQLHDIQVQAWSPLARGYLSGRSVAEQAAADQSATTQATAALVARMAEEKGVSREAIAIAWLMKHPANIQPVIGTTNPERIKACAEALQIELTRDEWYHLYVTSRGTRLP